MNKKEDGLKIYKKRRDLKKSLEPSGKSKTQKLKHPIYVIQKHKSSHLHYDFRIEIDGVLKSWAVPKGISLNPEIKHLAMPTDDHPLDYALFEGVIPKGNYGAGTVMVWDLGTYKNMSKEHDMKKSYKNGKIKIFIYGQKINGEFVLLRTKLASKGWLLIKMKDEYASKSDRAIKNKSKSALTRRTMLQINKNLN